MLQTTKQAISAVLAADPSINADVRKGIMVTLANPGSSKNEIPRVLSRQECGRILGVSVKRVDQLARAGHLKRVVTPGTRRSMGILETSIRVLVEGNAQ